jgi:arsenate reductase
MLKSVDEEVKKILKKQNEISIERKRLLNNFAEYISGKLTSENFVNLIFICTHNSRRSIMAQVWAQTAAEYFGIKNLKCFSGGTEITAFNPNAVKAMADAGFIINRNDKTENPIYFVRYSNDAEPVKCFSKIYSDKFNPQNNFIAIITCSEADKNCPVVIGAEKRFPITYNDPKKYDNTKLQKAKYSERFEQIGVEMLYAFKQIIN